MTTSTGPGMSNIKSDQLEIRSVILRAVIVHEISFILCTFSYESENKKYTKIIVPGKPWLSAVTYSLMLEVHSPNN